MVLGEGADEERDKSGLAGGGGGEAGHHRAGGGIRSWKSGSVVSYRPTLLLTRRQQCGTGAATAGGREG